MKINGSPNAEKTNPIFHNDLSIVARAPGACLPSVALAKEGRVEAQAKTDLWSRNSRMNPKLCKFMPKVSMSDFSSCSFVNFVVSLFLFVLLTSKAFDRFVLRRGCGLLRTGSWGQGGCVGFVLRSKSSVKPVLYAQGTIERDKNLTNY